MIRGGSVVIFSVVSLRLGKDIKDDTCIMVCLLGESVLHRQGQYHNIRKKTRLQPQLVVYRQELVTIYSQTPHLESVRVSSSVAQYKVWF